MIIGLDMDGTIVDFTTAAVQNANEIFGLNLQYEDMKDMKFAQQIRQELGPIYQEFSDDKSVYDTVCPDGFFYNLQPYTGAVEAVKTIAKEHSIIFITKPLEYKYSAKDKIKWLQKYFSDIECSVIFIQNNPDKGLIAVDVLVDDDPRVLKHTKLSTPICIEQPWNKNFRDNEFNGFTAQNMTEVVTILDTLSNNMNTRIIS